MKQFELHKLFLCITLIAIGVTLTVIPFRYYRYDMDGSNRAMDFMGAIGSLSPGFFFGAALGALFKRGFEGTVIGGALWLLLVAYWVMF